LRVSRSRRETSFQSCCAVGSTGLSTRCSVLLPGTEERRAYHRLEAASEARAHPTFAEKPYDLQGFFPSPHRSPQLWTSVLATPVRATLARNEQPFRTGRNPDVLWITGASQSSSILRAPPRPEVRATFKRRAPLRREAHVPAERPPPQAQARVSCAHVHPRRAGDSQAPPRQGAEAPLRLSSAPWSAGSACPVLATSTPSTDRDGRFRRAR
jgi:hypothetical protein